MPTRAAPEPEPLSETRDQIRFAAKDEGLRRDVHQLGTLVGRLIAEQGGETLYRSIERVRRLAIDRREGVAGAEAALDAAIGAIPAQETGDFIRAFSTYFQVVNIAELVHRIRRRRAWLREGVHRQPGGLEDTLCRLRDRGMTLDEVHALLARIEFMPVLTAHPTEPTRRTILRRQQDIVRRLIDMQNTALSPQELAADLEVIRTDITAIWQTEEHPTGLRTVADELEHVLYFVTEVVYRMMPLIGENLDAALRVAWGAEADTWRAPPVLHLGSWIGGDLVGRNEITARTIRETLARQRALILDLYHRECRELAEKLSQSTSRVTVDAALLERIGRYTAHFPNAPGLIPVRYREMPYRVFLRLMMARLQSTYSGGLFPYESADEFAGDVRLIADSLTHNQGDHAGLFNVQRLLRRVEAFGFHLMTIDIRQEAVANRSVVGRCLGEAQWAVLTPEYRCERLRQALLANESPHGALDNEAKRTIGIFQAIDYCRRRYGAQAIGPYVISHAEGPDDLLAVLLLAQWGDLRGADGEAPIDIAPGFETVRGLTDAPGVMAGAWRDPLYQAHLQARGQQQLVMLGIADSDVDSDLASARAALRDTQRQLTDAAAGSGLALSFMHGRFGTISPGGGKAHADILSTPRGTVHGRIRWVEPGEMVANKYGVRAIALRTLEQALGALLEVSARGASGMKPPPSRAWEAALDTLAAASRQAYQSLVRESPGFMDYYRLATPADAIERLRRGTGGPDMLVAEGLLAAAGTAPWVLAWTQSRNMLPGWYGFGQGLRAAIDEHGMDVLREMAGGWHFFATLLDDVEMVIAKSDLDIARRYSQLADGLHAVFFPRIEAGFTLTRRLILDVREQDMLLEKDNTLRRSILLRNPYVDPMSLLQVDLLRRWRQSGDDSLFNALIASINGIARGLQDSG